MSEIQLQDWMGEHARGVVIKGMLLRKYEIPEDLPLLDQDILEIELPNKIKIDVGWFPQNDPSGRFVIRVYRDARRRLLRNPSETTDPFAVAKIIGDLAQDYGSSRPPSAVMVSLSGNSDIRYTAAPRPVAI